VRLLIIRHGPAGAREEWEAEGQDDRLRPLTPKGKKVVRRSSAGLALLVPSLDVLATSPWTRAAQTAEIVAGEYECEIETVEQLTADNKPEDLMPWLEEQRQRDTVAVVGHEPHLSLLAGYLLTGRSASFVDLKKGGACLLELGDRPSPGHGTLEWLLSDRELRRLGEGKK
jgi:phosphohistidine phosphatase